MISLALGIRSRVANFVRASATIASPAELPRELRERLGRVDGAVDEQARRRRVDLREHPARPRARRSGSCGARISSSACPASSSGSVVADPLAAFEHEHVRAERLALDHGEEDGALVALDRPRARRSRTALTLRGAPRRRRSRRRTAGRPPSLPRPRCRTREASGSPRLEHLARALVDVRLDAAARHGPGQLARVRDGQLRADRPRRRPARRDHRRDRHLLSLRAPALDVVQDLLHAACLLSMPLRIVGELFEAREVVSREKTIDRRQCCPHARRRAAGSPGGP